MAQQTTIVRPIIEELSDTPYHMHRDGIHRELFLNSNLCATAPLHIAVHYVNVGETQQTDESYCLIHKHDCDEANLLLPQANHHLVFRYELDGKQCEVSGPATVVIPAGCRHSAEVVHGQGYFICMLMRSKPLQQLDNT